MKSYDSYVKFYEALRWKIIDYIIVTTFLTAVQEVARAFQQQEPWKNVPQDDF